MLVCPLTYVLTTPWKNEFTLTHMDISVSDFAVRPRSGRENVVKRRVPRPPTLTYVLWSTYVLAMPESPWLTWVQRTENSNLGTRLFCGSPGTSPPQTVQTW